MVLVLAWILLASTMAEPPVSSQYGTPSSPSGLSGQYGVPGRFGGQDRKGNYPSGGNAAGQYSATGNGEDGSSVSGCLNLNLSLFLNLYIIIITVISYYGLSYSC